MNVGPLASFEAVLEAGTTGLAATVGVEVNDNLGVVSVPFTTGAAEIAPGVYSIATLVAPPDEGQYTLIWRDAPGGNVLGTEALVVTSSAPGEPPTGDAYATVEELFRVLKIRNPTADQTAAAERVLIAAAGEIDAELSRTDDLEPWMVHLVTEVNLERAVEHWAQQESPFGVIGLGEPSYVVAAWDTWARHAYKLAPAKQGWGVG